MDYSLNIVFNLLKDTFSEGFPGFLGFPVDFPMYTIGILV
jgi:hypothetical protein